jgi:cytochrome P450
MTTSSLNRLAADFRLVSDLYDGLEGRDPYALFAQLRRSSPVMEGDILARFGVPSQADYARCGRRVYTVFRYDDVVRVLRDSQHWLSSLNGDGFGAAVDNLLLTSMDGETHRKFRALMSPPFSVTAARLWDHSLVQRIIQDEFIGPLRPRGQADLMLEFGIQFPVRLVYAILGFPDDPLAVVKFAGWALQVLAGPRADPDPAVTAAAQAASMEAGRHLFEHMVPIIRERRALSGQRADLIGFLLGVERDGARLTDAEIASYIRGVLLAATETTSRTFANLLLHLLTAQDLRDRVQADRSLIKRAMAESMRLEPVAGFLARMAAQDTILSNVTIPAGCAVSLCIGSAQRDETVFENPDTFDLDRPLKPQLGFGFGAHICMGQNIARMEIEAALDAVLNLPRLRLDPDFPAPVRRGLQFRSPDHLHVRWEA